jgi:hypothetical protein
MLQPLLLPLLLTLPPALALPYYSRPLPPAPASPYSPLAPLAPWPPWPSYPPAPPLWAAHRPSRPFLPYFGPPLPPAHYCGPDPVTGNLPFDCVQIIQVTCSATCHLKPAIFVSPVWATYSYYHFTFVPSQRIAHISNFIWQFCIQMIRLVINCPHSSN